ncbi:MAG: DEAD/DEAH box helicase [Bacillaceae bacterium]|nr:MAG: DEAD/DEAH box helicase [Bacillaceae bacterium]
MAANFKDFPFQDFIIDAVQSLGFKEPTEIQAQMIPIILRGASAIGQSQTGTGKTHAYLLPLINSICGEEKRVQVVVLAPTRELATQIYEEALKIIKFAPPEKELHAKLFIGGTDKMRAIEKLKTQPHLVIGTPGRILDLVKEGALDLYSTKSIVVDEADLMLDLGFIYEVDQIASRMKKELQMLVFSATIPEKLKPFLKKYMENPEYVHVSPKQVHAKNITHVLVPLRHRNKIDLLYNMVVSLNPYLALIFVNTKANAQDVAYGLAEKGLKVGQIHGGLTPRERKKEMRQIKDLAYQVVVATDLAARGIDIEGVSHVINAELPTDLDFYIHRTGRTARAGFSGFAYTIYEDDDEQMLQKLEKMGIIFENRDIENGIWKTLDDRNRRQKRKKQPMETNAFIGIIKKPKSVKPGYKKKMKEQIEKLKKKQARKNK